MVMTVLSKIDKFLLELTLSNNFVLHKQYYIISFENRHQQAVFPIILEEFFIEQRRKQHEVENTKTNY